MEMKKGGGGGTKKGHPQGDFKVRSKVREEGRKKKESVLH